MAAVETARRSSEVAKTLKTVEEFDKSTETTMRSERFLPIAALARQAIETAAGLWLQAHGVVVERLPMNTQFTIIRSIHEDPDLAAELSQTWRDLHVCHATTYDMPPTSDELGRWQTTIQRFLTDPPGS